ncbi:tripartite tricarboxylate transporter permease [Petroclostridium sp. X23]|uniref:tripartite tricarboxylate transporter permease n=1 Tax=Petroclostridium sp. X23 TaxID=3045146 RepID=UPI0024AE3CE5|nr:tripartite tricarboxylate transporter permease [Petroclostridium sp. X23]WHH61017.1 tripartite tricarboxylate transporter permease [Petroclostridium sp. X23]
MLENIISGFINLFAWNNFLFINIGLAVGIIFGALPGLSATMGVALFMPLTFGMDPITGILMLLGIYCGGTYGGSITAILINTPGTPASAATVLDGYTMAKNGHAGKALQMALIASTIAGVFSALILLFIAPQVASMALKFGPPEYFALAIFGLSIISSVCSDSVFKGIIMGILGMFISMIGMDPIGGMPRLTFDYDYLAAGINLIPALIGLFAISEILNKVRILDHKVEHTEDFMHEKVSLKEVVLHLKTILKSSAIGTFIGAIPGTGAAIASFLSYNEAKRVSKTPEKFGTGHLDGVAASEAGNNGVTGATLIPLLTLGVPGDTVTAILLGALMMQGLTPGPDLFKTHGIVVYTIMIGLIFVNIFMYLQASYFIKGFVRITKVPVNFLIPILIILCVTGAYAANNTLFDVKMILIFGALGYLMTRFDFPVTPMLLAIILGPMAEVSMRQSMILSEGSYAIFFTRPISLIFLILAVLSVIFSSITRSKRIA